MSPTREAGLPPPPAWLLISHAKRAAGSRPSSACVEPLRRPLAVTAGWADTSASESACLLRGGHPTERAGSVVWACTPDPVDLSPPRRSPPLLWSAASALLEGSDLPQAEEKSHVEFFAYIYSYMYYNNDYYYRQIITEVAQLRQHKQRLNDLRTQLG